MWYSGYMKITLSYVPHVQSFICVDVQSVQAMNELMFFPLMKDDMYCYSFEQISLLIKTLEKGESVEFIK